MCMNYGTGNPYLGTSQDFDSNTLSDENLEKAYEWMNIEWARIHKEKILKEKIEELREKIKKFENSIWYKVYKFFGGY